VTEKTKHVLAAFGGTPGAISPQFFYASAHCGPTTYIPGFIQIRSGLGSYNEKSVRNPGR